MQRDGLQSKNLGAMPRSVNPLEQFKFARTVRHMECGSRVFGAAALAVYREDSQSGSAAHLRKASGGPAAAGYRTPHSVLRYTQSLAALERAGSKFGPWRALTIEHFPNRLADRYSSRLKCRFMEHRR